MNWQVMPLQIVGGVVGGLFAVGLIIIAAAYVIRARNRSRLGLVSETQSSRPGHKRGPSSAPTVSSFATLESPTMASATQQPVLKLYGTCIPGVILRPESLKFGNRSGRSEHTSATRVGNSHIQKRTFGSFVYSVSDKSYRIPVFISACADWQY
jgi:hypothetical protein